MTGTYSITYGGSLASRSLLHRFLQVFRKYLPYIPISALCIALFVHDLTTTVPSFHPDESEWLGNAVALRLVLNGEFDHPYWRDYFGWIQTHAGHYTYGVVLRAGGITHEMMHGRYELGRDRRRNPYQGQRPSQRVLLLARRFSAVCGALACVVICEIGRRTFGWIAGLTAACWLAANPLMRLSCQRAMIDGQLTLAICVGILVMFLLYRAWERRGPWMLLAISLGVGVLFGLTTALKFNGGILCLVAIASLPCFALHQILQVRRKRNGKRRIVRSEGEVAGDGSPRAAAQKKRVYFAVGSVAVVCVCAIATFYAINPQVWPKGLRHGVKRMLARRDAEVAAQQRRHPEAALTSVSQRVTAGAHAYFVRFPTLRRLLGKITNRPGALSFVDALLFLVGLGWLFERIVGRARREGVVDPACIVGLWLLLYSSFVFLMIPLTFQRYYQKLLPLQALLVGIGVTALVQIVIRLRQSRRRRAVVS